MSDPENTQQTINIQENIASLLTYLLGFISGIIFLVLEKKNKKIRIHALQSIIISVGFMALGIVLNIIYTILLFIPGLGPLVVGLISLVFGLASLGAWIGLMVMAYLDRKITIPVVTELAEKWEPTVLP